MKNRAILLAVAVALGACGGAEQEAPSLSMNYDKFGVADFSSAEAITAMCDENEAAFRERFKALENWTGTPTIDNYYRPADAMSTSVFNLQAHASSISGVHPDPEIRAASEACDLKLQALGSEMSLSRPIYDHVSAIDLSEADAETRFSVEKTLQGLRLSGVDKDEATREKIRELNDRIAAVGQEFDRNIRDAVGYLELDSVDDLAGMPEDYIAAHPPNDEGKILISTQYPDALPLFEYADNDDVRREMSSLYGNRAYPENEEVLRNLIEARYELAQLVGFNNFAELVTADKMSGSPERVAEFLGDLKGYTGDSQQAEYDVLLARLQQDHPEAERVEPWQGSYVRSQVRREQYAVDTKQIREYFNYEASRDGIATLVEDLFGVQIVPWETETWHEDVDAYELRDGDKVIGRFYLDMHPREGKYGHAAMFPFVNGIDGVQLPVAGLICNFPEGTGPMQHGQVNTFLHEFGHLLHWMFAGHNKWSNTSGITTEWDFVEAPSQMLEEWIWDYDTISVFAKNSKGEVIPRELFDSMLSARDFGLGMGTRRQLAFAGTSMGLYNADPDEIDFDELMDGATREYTLIEPQEGTHRWASFGHLNGYSAIYYTYQWSNAIATDMFTQFEENGLRNVETARAYREKVLAAGGTKPADELVADFLGRPVSFESYAKKLRGDE